MSDKNEYVVFENSAGEEISNDPRWIAEKTLRDAGVELPSGDSAEVQAEIEAKNAEIEQLKAALAAKEAAEAELENDDDAPEPDLDENGNRTYKELDSKALKALAGERNVDISGLTKVGEVRKALIGADAKA